MQALAILLLAATLAAPAAAGTITITITQLAHALDGKLVVDLTVGNSGDEAALSVTPILRFGDEEARGKGRPSLDPGTSFDETLSLRVGTLGEGRWPYGVAVDYTDRNQYAFQALQMQALVVGSPPPAKVAVSAVRGGNLSGSGTLAVTLENLTPEIRTARIRVLAPAGLDVTDGSRELSLDPWADEELMVALTNRTVLAGSRYPVFVTAEYEDGPVHQAVVAQGTVAIIDAGTFLERWGRGLQLAAIALVVAWLGYLGAHLLQRRATAAPS
jgi:hypothetical protein